MERSTTGDKLEQVYMNLEEEWDCIKKSKLRTSGRRSTDTSIMVKTLPVLESSPRTLMSSLQHRMSRSASDEIVTWKVRTNDLAVMEILRERREAIESGKLKGRRLFEEFEGWNNNGLNEECEVRSVSVTSYDGDDGSEEEFPVAVGNCASVGVCVAQMKQGEKKVMVEEHKRGVGRIVVLVLLAVALVICATGITSMRRYRDEYGATLVPT